MADPQIPNQLILYHYPFSPYARRIVFYLTLRRIAYAECIQAPYPPRPDLSEQLKVNYRRIPVMAINGEIYCDTRLILRKLETLQPPGSLPPLGATDNDNRAIQLLLDKFVNDAGIFGRGAQAIPPDMPVLRDPKFTADRKQFMGRDMSPEIQRKGRPEALIHLREAYQLLESTLLADGRKWLLKGSDGPTLSDLEAVWPLIWLASMKGSMPEEVAGPALFPKVFSWIDRFNAEVKKGSKDLKSQIVTLKGDAAAKAIFGAAATASATSKPGVMQGEPTDFKVGDEVVVWPIESGFTGRDQGKLVTLQADEIVIAKSVNGRKLNVHFPRWGFRISETKDALDSKI